MKGNRSHTSPHASGANAGGGNSPIAAKVSYNILTSLARDEATGVLARSDSDICNFHPYTRQRIEEIIAVPNRPFCFPGDNHHHARVVGLSPRAIVVAGL